MMQPIVSIVIPLYKDTPEFRQCVKECLSLDYAKKEIIVVSDYAIEVPAGVKLVLTGQKQTGPAEKRDIALAQQIKGELVAFIDDDAFPRRNWLSNAVKYFFDENIAAVGGPGLTPKENNFFQKLGGAFLENFFGSATMTHRFRCENNRFVDDFPAYNFIARKSALLAVGGFSSKFYGGEDTKLCLSLVNSGKKILYAGDVVVFHHRRPFPLKHWKQVWNVAVHRGYFAKVFPETSARLQYFLPTIGTVSFFVFFSIAFFNHSAFLLLASLLVSYFGAVFFSGLRNGFFVASLLPAAVLSTHIVYGTGFVHGLLKRNLER